MIFWLLESFFWKLRFRRFTMDPFCVYIFFWQIYYFSIYISSKGYTFKNLISIQRQKDKRKKNVDFLTRAWMKTFISVFFFYTSAISVIRFRIIGKKILRTTIDSFLCFFMMYIIILFKVQKSEIIVLVLKNNKWVFQNLGVLWVRCFTIIIITDKIISLFSVF